MRFIKSSDVKELTELDVKNKKILLCLSENARMPHAKIAKKIGLSKDAVAYRIRKMEERGVIQGYLSIIDISQIGFGTYHLFIRLNKPSKEKQKKIIEAVRVYDFVKVVIEFSDKYDFEIGVAAKNVEELDERIRTITKHMSQYLEEIKVLILAKNYVSRTFPKAFYQNGYFEEKTNTKVDIDKKDIKILDIVSENASMTLHEIGKSVGLSSDAVNYRLKKMRESLLIRHVPAINYSNVGYTVYAVLMDIRTIGEEKEKKLAAFLKSDDNIIWASKTIGNYNLLAYICVKNSEQFHKTIDSMRNLFSSDIKNYETLIAYEEYKYTYFPKVCSDF